MRRLLAAFLALTPLPIAAGAHARDLAGRYRLAEGPDAAGALELTRDGRFGYELAVGALDERAQGRWVRRGAQACLTTQPTPKPPEFVRLAPRGDQTATVLVEAEDGRGIGGVDVTVGFDSGDPATGYTQYYGWSLPEDETRSPRWIELNEPIHRFASPRLPLTPADRGHLRAMIVANDIGVVDFRDACFEAQSDGFVLRRAEGEMHFRRVED
jgi:hypothetical protein